MGSAKVGGPQIRNALALHIGLAFGLFALSHGAAILGKAESLEALLILLHAVGYILIAVAIYKVAFPRKPQDY
jgi:hypothetical protein